MSGCGWMFATSGKWVMCAHTHKNTHIHIHTLVMLCTASGQRGISVWVGYTRSSDFHHRWTAHAAYAYARGLLCHQHHNHRKTDDDWWAGGNEGCVVGVSNVPGRIWTRMRDCAAAPPNTNNDDTARAMQSITQSIFHLRASLVRWWYGGRGSRGGGGGGVRCTSMCTITHHSRPVPHTHTHMLSHTHKVCVYYVRCAVYLHGNEWCIPAYRREIIVKNAIFHQPFNFHRLKAARDKPLSLSLSMTISFRKNIDFFSPNSNRDESAVSKHKISNVECMNRSVCVLQWDLRKFDACTSCEIAFFNVTSSHIL